MSTTSIVIPMYNYASRIHKTIDSINTYCNNSQHDWEVIFVDDGSTDTTVKAVTTLIEPYAYMKLIQQPGNLGKGAAVRRGLIEATGDVRIFTDCDLAYSLDQIDKVLESIDNGADFVFADRRHPDSKCIVDKKRESYQQRRDVMSFVLNRLVWGIGLGDIRDTQAGLKGISTSMMPLIERGMINGFPFDIELFAIATANNLSIEAVPVEYYIEDAPSTVMPIPVALDFIKCIGVIRRNFKRGRYHAAPPQT